MRSSSLKLLLKAGVENPREYRDKVIHEWFLTSEEIKYLTYYSLRSIPIEKFFNSIDEDGELWHNEYNYQLVWIHKPESVRQSGLAIVSFRFCDMLNCGYALVKKNQLSTYVPKVFPQAKHSFISRLLKRNLT